jgi:hypothetical protein
MEQTIRDIGDDEIFRVLSVRPTPPAAIRRPAAYFGFLEIERETVPHDRVRAACHCVA